MVNILGRCTSAVLDCVITSRRSTIVVHSIAMSLSVCLSRCMHNKQYVEDDHEALGRSLMSTIAVLLSSSSFQASRHRFSGCLRKLRFDGKIPVVNPRYFAVSQCDETRPRVTTASRDVETV